MQKTKKNLVFDQNVVVAVHLTKHSLIFPKEITAKSWGCSLARMCSLAHMCTCLYVLTHLYAHSFICALDRGDSHSLLALVILNYSTGPTVSQHSGNLSRSSTCFNTAGNFAQSKSIP